MIGRLIARLTIAVLKCKRLTGEDKAMVTSALIDNIHAIPIRSVISYSQEGRLIINGREMPIDHIVPFVEGCQALRDSVQRKVIRDQILYNANEIGIAEGLTPDMILFSKAAIWVVREQDRLIDELANR